MEISKFAVIHAHEHQSDHKNITNDFCIHFLQCIHSRKSDSVNGMPEYVA